LGHLGLAPGRALQILSIERRGVLVRVDKERQLLPTDLAELLFMEGDTQ